MITKCEHGFWGCQWHMLKRGLPAFALCLLHAPSAGLAIVTRVRP